MRALVVAVALCSALISACGGGGGGGGSTSPPSEPPPTPTPPLQPTTYSLSGTITASGSQAVDSDTNDRTREAVSNDTLQTAQPIPNPVTLGGYVNQPGAGATGRSSTEGDVNDFYLVQLLAGQRITMLVADFIGADADLLLYNSAGELIDFSIDTGEIETLLIAEDGEYFVSALAVTGATNYTLAIGGAAGAPVGLSSQADIVPWEVVVQYRAAKTGANSADSNALAGLGMERLAGDRGREQLVAMRTVRTARNYPNMPGGGARSIGDAIVSDTLRARWQTLQAVKALRRATGVAHAEPNYRIRTSALPDDELYPLQWHYPLIGLPAAWETTSGSEAVVVAVIDTGILPGHPDLLGQLVDGFDFVQDVSNSGDGDGIDPDPTDPGEALGGGGSFHGTHVSGTVAARGDNGRGVAGVAYSSRIMPLRALGADGGTTYDLAQAIRYAAALTNDSGSTPAKRADIINLSLGGAPFSQTLQDLLLQVRNSGIIIVAAAGNEASSLPSYPAAFDGVVSVSAIDSQRVLAPYSNNGPTVDVAAPGGNSSIDLTGDGYPDGVLSTAANNSNGQLTFVYSFLNGTSMAAPHVAGVIALMKSINPDLTPEDVDTLLTTGAITDDLGAPGRDDQFGYGLINAQLAVLAALESIGSTPADSPRLVTSSGTLNFGATTPRLNLSLRNGGKGDLSLTSLSVTAPWLTVRPQSVDSNGLGEFDVTVDRAGLSAGVYTTDIVAQSSVNTATVRVFMSVGGEDFRSDVGVLYVLLYDPLDNEPVAQFVATGESGVYPFAFDGIAAGEYDLLAGSDADNDLLVCDAGESCGAYLTIDQPIRLQVGEDLQGLDFPAEFVVSLPSVAINKTADSRRQGTVLRRRGAAAPAGTD